MRLAAGFLSLSLLSAAENTDAVRLLRENCVSCHNGSARMSGLDLTSREGALKGGGRGTAVIPGNASASLLMKAVAQDGPLKMPPGKALAARDVAAIRGWIDGGALWTDDSSGRPAPAWWSFRAPVRGAVPVVNGAWARNDIDRFILSRMNQQGLKPAPEAGRASLIRRVYYDLTGLPPSAAQVEAFAANKSPGAYEELVEELLASPRYGERWGRHWLDLVRYSDTAGFELDSYIADAWRYRDYVIESFNQDKPYDRFIREQIAGDEFFPEDPVANTGTGLYCVGPNRDLFPDQADINRVEVLTDYVDTTGSVFLGLTVGCARCHDHKFDPIPQRDYYRLQAIFAPAVKTKVALNRLGSLAWDVGENHREIKLRDIGEEIQDIQRRCREKLRSGPEGERRAGDEAIRGCLNPEEAERLRAVEKRLVTMYANHGPKPFACGITDVGDYAPRTVLPVRGSQPEEEVEPGFLTALGGGHVPRKSFVRETTGPIPLFPTTGRRHALANWIARADNPLTARVMVNRIWQHHFGRGIVATANDFGTRGRAPSHPELLDWLADEFVSQGWSIKKIHRLILTSATYRQSAAGDAVSFERDPENIYLSRFSRRRLEAEEIRDSVLALAGTLNLQMGGRPVVPPLSKEELFNLIGRVEEMWMVTRNESEHARRGVYLFQKRTFRLPMMEVFDAPESMLTCSRRESSTTAPQSLTLLNGSFVTGQAQRLAAKLASEHADDASLSRAAIRQILLREPGPAEAAAAVDLLRAQSANTGSRTGAAAELIRGLFNLNEFLYVD